LITQSQRLIATAILINGSLPPAVALSLNFTVKDGRALPETLETMTENVARGRGFHETSVCVQLRSMLPWCTH